MNPLAILGLKGVALAAVLIGAWWLWDHDREAYAAARVEAFADKVREEAEADWRKKLDVAERREAAVSASAAEAQQELQQLKEQIDEKNRLIASRDRLVAGLRATATGPRRSEVRSDPGSACHAQELRSERLASAVEDLQRRGIEVASGAAELQGLLLECDEGARRDAVNLRWWSRVDDAVRLGEEPPPRP